MLANEFDLSDEDDDEVDNTKVDTEDWSIQSVQAMSMTTNLIA